MRLLIVPALALAISLVLYVLLGQMTEIPSSFEDGVGWIQGSGSWLWLAASAVIVADSFLILPSDAAMMALGLVYGPVFGGAMAGVASVMGGLVAFGAVRGLGERFATRVVGERDLGRAREFFGRWGVYSVAIARAVGGVVEPVIMLSGLSRMTWRSVAYGLCLGGIPAGVLKASLGTYAEQHPASAITAAAALALLTTGIARGLSRSRSA